MLHTLRSHVNSLGSLPGMRGPKPALRMGIVGFALTLLLGPLSGTSSDAPSTPGQEQEYRIRLYHTHTSERIDIVYRRGVTYLPAATAHLDHFLRDHRTGEMRHFDPRLFDVLAELSAAVGRPGAELHIICGYRSLWSNEFLRRQSTGVSKNSLHMRAEALDVRLPGTKTETLRQAALSLNRGGVGYYPRSDFIHVDLGRTRQWCLGCAAPQRPGS